MKSKQQLIKEFLASPVKIGEVVYVENQNYHADVIKVHGNGDLTCTSKYKSSHVLVKKGNYKRILYFVGYNPFSELSFRAKMRSSAYDLETILMKVQHKPRVINGINVEEVNFNATAFGKVIQRTYVWKLKDQQKLIKSICEGSNIGIFIFRLRSDEWVDEQTRNRNTNVAYQDCIDGQQRLKTIIRFVNNEFPDENGIYYKDFSDNAQKKFKRFNNLAYFEMKEDTTDMEALDAFLNVNIAGVPQSEEHIAKMKKLKEDNS